MSLIINGSHSDLDKHPRWNEIRAAVENYVTTKDPLPGRKSGDPKPDEVQVFKFNPGHNIVMIKYPGSDFPGNNFGTVSVELGFDPNDK